MDENDDGKDISSDEIAFSSSDGVLYIMNLKTRGMSKVINSVAYAPIRWSPDGERIAYRAPYGGWEGYQIYVVNADGTGKRVVTLWERQGQIEPHPDGGFGPVWSLDRTRIAFTRCINCEVGGLNSEIYIVNLDTTEGVEETRLTHNLYSDFVLDWSPDGRKILFYSNFSLDSTWDRYGDLYSMNLDGSNKQRIIKNLSTFAGGLHRYSPDGKSIAFIGRDKINEIYIMTVDGARIIKITNNKIRENYLSWSSDGTRLVFMAGSPNSGGHIYIINIDGTGLKQITTGEAKYFSPEWRPNIK